MLSTKQREKDEKDEKWLSETKEALWKKDLCARATRIKNPPTIPRSLQLEYNRDRKRLAAERVVAPGPVHVPNVVPTGSGKRKRADKLTVRSGT